MFALSALNIFLFTVLNKYDKSTIKQVLCCFYGDVYEDLENIFHTKFNCSNVEKNSVEMINDNYYSN